jgi:hypothetical protein
MRGAAVAVVGAVALMLGGTVMVAWAVVGRGTLDPTGTGNSLPIDDNHRSLRPTPAAPGDGLGTAALHDDRQDDGRPVPGVVPGGTDPRGPGAPTLVTPETTSATMTPGTTPTARTPASAPDGRVSAGGDGSGSGRGARDGGSP